MGVDWEAIDLIEHEIEFGTKHEFEKENLGFCSIFLDFGDIFLIFLARDLGALVVLEAFVLLTLRFRLLGMTRFLGAKFMSSNTSFHVEQLYETSSTFSIVAVSISGILKLQQQLCHFQKSFYVYL